MDRIVPSKAMRAAEPCRFTYESFGDVEDDVPRPVDLEVSHDSAVFSGRQIADPPPSGERGLRFDVGDQ